MFESFESRLEITGWLTAETAVHIGAGRSTELVGTDLPVVRDARGLPYIPGSSFKGVLRSRLESMLRAVADGRDSRRFACNPTAEDEWCVTNEEAKGLKEEVRKLEAAARDHALTDRLVAKTCPVCCTFGSPWLASPLVLSDLPVDEELWAGQFQVRNGVAIDRDTETAEDGKLYDYEVVPPGARFRLRLLLDNAQPWQYGMLFAGLKMFEDATAPVGGGRSRGLGWMRLRREQTRLFSLRGKLGADRADAICSFLAGDGFVPVSDKMIAGWLADFRGKLGAMALQGGA